MGWVERRCRCRTAEQKRNCRCPSSVVSYRAGYYVGGEKVQQTVSNRAEAKRWLATQEADVAVGRHVDPRSGEMLFADWAEEWRLTRTGKASARDADAGRLNKHVIPAFGHLPLSAIGPVTVRQWVAKLSNSGALAPKTVRHCHALLHGILDAAIEQRLIGANPCRGTQLPEDIREDPVYLTEQECQRLIAAADEHWRPLLTLLLCTGLRWGEAVGLRHCDVDLVRRELRVRVTWSDGYGDGTPKTRTSRRTLSLPALAVDAIVPAWTATAGQERLFSAPRGGPVRHSAFTRFDVLERDGQGRPVRVKRGPWWRAVDAALLEGKRPTPHDLRHSHAAHLIAAGVPLTAIQRRLGHESVKTTSDIYGGLLPRVDEALVAAIDLALTPAEEMRPPQELRRDAIH